jgi:hypothetical protein
VSEANRLQLAYDDFARDFLAPLLTGGSVRVGRPLSPAALEHFALARPSDPELDETLFDALHAAASQLAPVEALPHPERGAVALAMASYDLIAVTDPMMSRAFARRARPVVLGWVDALLHAVDPPETRGQALIRHALVDRVLSVRRSDTVVHTWAYTHRYQGRPVPPRVVSMPKLRMVREQRSERALTELWEELHGEEQMDLRSRVRELLARSPVTELTRPDFAVELQFGLASLRTLSDPSLRSGVAHRWATLGLGRIAEPVGRALRRLLDQDPDPRLLRPALAAIWESHVVALLEGQTLDRSPEPFAESLLEASTDSPDAALFAAVLPTVTQYPTLVASAGPLEPEDAERVHGHARQLKGELDAEPLQRLRDALAPFESTEPRAPATEVHP